MVKPVLYLALGFSLLGATPAPAAPVPTPLVPAWVPDPALAARLAPPTILGRFQVQLPKGYKSGDTGKADANTTVYTYYGPGKHSASFLLFVSTLSQEDRRQVLKSFTNRTPMLLHTHHYTQVTVSATEEGTIHGMLFKRIHWSGTGSVEGKAQGIAYYGLSGSTLLQIQADSPDKSALSLVEASVLTLQPK